MPENYTGTIGEELIEVIYYYQPKKYEYTVEYYFEGILDETLTENLTAEYGSEISTYPDKVKPKYHFDKSENLPLIITTNPEENIIKIYYRKNSYDITTEVEGEGGSISGEGEQPYESVLAKYDSTKDIIVTPEKGYAVKEIKVNGTTTTSYTENEDGTVTLSKFTTMLEDKHVVASFRKLFTIVKQGEEETTLLPGAKFTIKDEKGNYAIDRNGQTVGEPETIDGQELYVVTTDEDGRIDVDLKPGKYIITEVQAPENYILPELEEDRTYTIEVEAEIKEEKELKKSRSNMISFDAYNFEVFNVEVSQDKGLILSGGIVEETTILAENTVANQDIILTKIGIVDGIIVQTDELGKIKWIKQIKSNDENSANLIMNTIQLPSGEYIAMGAFMGIITISAEETSTGESMTITSESEMDTYIIKYNSEGKVELLVASEKNMSDGSIVKLKSLQNGELMMSREFTHYEVPGANTVSGEDIALDSTSSGILMVTYNSEGKVKSAKELEINEDLLNTICINSITLTSDGGYIISADTDTNQQITVPAEDTTDGNEIIITQDENKGFQAIAIKCNSDGKVEYIKKIDSEDNQSEFTSLMYINEIDDGYIALEYEGENLEDGSYQARILLLKLNSSLEIEHKLDIGVDTEEAESYWDIVSNDAIRIEQVVDGSYTMLNGNDGELLNYIEEVVVEGFPADAPTLTVSNELQKYEYRVEYYYDGEIDESLTETLEEKYGKTVESYTDKVKENYVLEKTENFPLTITNEPEKNVIKIYYATKAEARVQYIDKDTGEIIYEETEDGYVGKEFDTEAKDFENYVLVEEPEEKTIEMQEETIVIKYYYVRVSSGVIEKHIDITSGEILFNTTYEGVVGTPYSTAPKEFEGYDFVQERYPENAEGQMEVDVITVTYYYIKRVTIKVEYVDIDTNEKIEEEITINGHEGDEYSTEQKEIEGYEFVEVTEDKEGNMTEDKTITYYYKKIVPIPVEPEEPEQPVTPPESTPGNRGEDPTIADTIIPAAGIQKAIIVLTLIAMFIGILDIITYKKYKKLLRDFK